VGPADWQRRFHRRRRRLEPLIKSGQLVLKLNNWPQRRCPISPLSAPPLPKLRDVELMAWSRPGTPKDVVANPTRW
jgi:hypothetical protein